MDVAAPSTYIWNMEPEAILSAAADLIRMIPRSGLLIGTIGALLLGFVGSMMLRRKVAGGRVVRTVSTLALSAILVTVFLQIARFDPRLDSMTTIGLPDQTIVGEETVIPMAPDGHYWLRANVNGVPTRLMVDTGATLTAFSSPSADAAGLEPRPGGLPVVLSTANGTVTADLTTIDDLSFGNIQAEGLDAVIAPNLGRTNVLGMNFLSRLEGWRVENGDLILTPAQDDLQ